MPVKKSGWIILTFACAALFLWAGSALVEGPVLLAPPDRPEAPAAHAPYLTRDDALPAEMSHTARAEDDSLRRTVLHAENAAADAACVQVADSNGCPITGRTYVRTVYTACPLEDMPG